MVKNTEIWAANALAAAMRLTSSLSSSSTLSLQEKVEVPQSEEVKAARRIVQSTVERGRKVFGIIYSSLPEELRIQIEHIKSGWSYGLWIWLERKY